MDDLFHRFLKWVSYNRGLAVALCIAAPLFALTSCESTTQSPLTSKPATHAQLDVEHLEAVAALTHDEEAARAAYDTAVARVQRETELRLAELAGQFKLSQDARNESARVLGAKFEAAHADINRKDELKMAVVEKIRMATTLLPPGLQEGATLVLATMLGGVGWDNRRKNAKINELKGASNAQQPTA